MAISSDLCPDNRPRKQDSLWSWLVCVCATLSWISSHGILFSYAVLLPVFMDYFGASREFAALVGSVAIALTFFAGLFATSLVTWFGCRVTALMGGGICAVSLIISSFANDMTILLFSYGILFGFGCSCTFSSGIMVIKLYFSKIQAIAVGVLSSGIGIGALIMSPILEILTRATDWQTTFLIMAGVVLLTSLCAVTFDPNVEKDQEIGSYNEKEIEQINGEREHRSIVSEMQRVFDVSVWKELPVVVFFLPEFFVAFGHFVPQIHLVRYCEELGISSQEAARLLVYRGLCSAAGRLLAGFACNHPRVGTFHVFQAAEFTAGLSAILMTVAPTFLSLIVCNVMYGLADGVFYTCVSCLILTVSPMKTAAVLGWMMTMESIFVASGPPLAGWLADKLESYVLPFRVGGGITLVGAFIPFALLCHNRESQHTDHSRPDNERQKLLK
ncbi:monocarboxylate transporter 10-like isoform X1 [Acropora muricata]|uniref:monocarboxylate transporter 10-like isoform X1 n=1 Tax=Acropora muricata TaxID=159855 RepID=UPI0034E469A9